ncbi:MAG: hypothetical protein MRQ10_05515 [Candidatus Midichloria mitochondrii]|nr:hypothetical protein [Candidatus Midichloria mitochondrii]
MKQTAVGNNAIFVLYTKASSYIRKKVTFYCGCHTGSIANTFTTSFPRRFRAVSSLLLIIRGSPQILNLSV